MKRCLFADYVETFLTVRELLAVNDNGGGSLLDLRRGIEHLFPDSRTAATLGFEDAMAGRPLRARVHFCRMHVGAACFTCEHDGPNSISGGEQS
ncbi:MAG: hypothetical protein A2V77_05555 [Anaeromyxobacter sp. RBG_16_69_14]|nr:MAG: hypothetical protein A2V77_05555 [Anaeromyxobacter sp. RBG_16_69_14]